MDLLDKVVDQTVDPNKDYLKELVGENAKFKTVNDLARGKYEADLWIEQKKTEFDKLREDYLKLHADYNARAKLEELIDRFDKRQDPPRQEPEDTGKGLPTFDPTQIDSLVETKLKAYEQTNKELKNFNEVQDTLKKEWGENYPSHLQSRINTLGLTKDFVNQLARTHPQVLYRTLGVGEPKGDGFQAPPQSTQRDTFVPKQNIRSYGYYREMRDKDPKKYYDPKTQAQMMKDMTNLGDKFQDNVYQSGL